MDKNTEIKLVGQPIFKQLLKLVDKGDFDRLVKSKNSDRYYKTFTSWTQTVTMLFGILSRCDSMAETCEGIRGMSGKLNHLGLKLLPKARQAMDYETGTVLFLRHCIIV